MSYEETWKVLADLLTDLREKGEMIPGDIMEDLRSAKTLINLLEVDPEHIENLTKLETFMSNVESYLIFVAQDKFGNEYAEGWMKKLEEAGKKFHEKKEKKPVKPVTGIPRDKKWVRVQLSKDTRREHVEELAKENKLSYKIQENEYVLVYGDGEKIKTFVSKMRENFKERKKQ